MVPCAAFTSDGQRVAVSGLSSSTIAIWDLAGPALVAELETCCRCGAIAFNNAGDRLAWGIKSWGLNEHIVLIIWDLNELECAEGLMGWVDTSDLEFSPDGSYLARANGIAEIFDVGNMPHFEGNVLYGYDTPRNDPIAMFSIVPVEELAKSGQYVERVVFAPDSTSLATGTLRGTVTIWDISNGEKIREIQIGEVPLHDQGAAVTALTYSPDGSLLMIGTLNQGMYAWNVTTGNLEILLEQGEPSSALAFSQGGQLFISGHEDAVRIWRTKDYKLLCEFRIDSYIITAISIDRTQRHAYATDLSGEMLTFDIGSACLLVSE
jgi:WD40 repeat protein